MDREFGDAVFNERSCCISCGGVDLENISSGLFNHGAVGEFINSDPWGEHPAPFLAGKSWSFVACKKCGTRFHRNILNSEWNERRFTRWMSQEAIEEFESKIRTPERDFRTGVGYTSHVLQIEKLTRKIRGSKRVRVLDFGCGYGGFLSMCSLYGFDAIGIDRAVAKLENNLHSRVYPEIEDVGDLKFHALTLFEVIEHLDDPREVLKRLSGLLVDGGILVLEVPNCSGVSTIESRYDYGKIHPLEHINAFTPDTLRKFAERLGFRMIRKPVSYVANDPKLLAKTIAKSVVAPLMKPTTQMYFRKN